MPYLIERVPKRPFKCYKNDVFPELDGGSPVPYLYIGGWLRPKRKIDWKGVLSRLKRRIYWIPPTHTLAFFLRVGRVKREWHWRLQSIHRSAFLRLLYSYNIDMDIEI